VKDVNNGDKLLMGRGQGVQVWINDKNISREHCQIVCDKDTLFIEDLGSRNGTYINGEKIINRIAMTEGDEIRLASSSLVKISLPKKATPIPVPTIERAKSKAMESKAVDERLGSILVEATAKVPIVPPVTTNKADFSLVGKVFNGYRIDSRVGSGGMSVVYKGIHLALSRPVAIKTLAHHLLQNPKAVKRFLNVAKIAGQLTHPNIVQIYDSGSLDEYGIYYIVMEFVDGESLNNLLKPNGKMQVEETCKVIGHVAGALDYANKKNIIHRDINPSNILVGKENVPKVIGLGLAKCLDNEITSLTQPGKGMGMVGYIAPEQLLDASKADHRSDIYSLGAVFYRCMCGQTPYDTKNMREYFNCIHNRIPPVPPHELNPEVPRVLSDIMTKCLAYDPDERYPNAEEFLLDLKPYFTPRGEKEGIEKAQRQINAMFNGWPKSNSIPGLEFESAYRPVQGIGGDFYDFIELNQKEIGIVIGDVTGHGVEAAVVVGMVKTAIKIMGKQSKSTAEALRRANEEIYPDLDATTFATVAYGIIDRDVRNMRFSRAGHNPLILYNPQRNPTISTYDPKGMVMGMFSKCECEEITISLSSGDCLIQYTDGITESMDAEREEFGLDRLCQTINGVGVGDLRKILNAVEQAVTAFAGAEGQQDDITIIGIKVL
jgi:serine/threonine protein kinase